MLKIARSYGIFDVIVETAPSGRMVWSIGVKGMLVDENVEPGLNEHQALDQAKQRIQGMLDVALSELSEE